MTHATSRRHGGPAFPRLVAAFVVSLSGCAIVPPTPQFADAAPPQWGARLPHDGSRAELVDWWARFDDPLLSSLVESAQRNSPTLEQATQRIVEARANARIAGASLSPRLDANASSVRGNSLLITAGTPAPSTLSSATLDAAWEIDWFGAARNRSAAARARVEASEALWHDARVSLAAEVAGAYVGLRACEALVDIEEAQSASLARTADLTRRKVEGGFEAPANSALARASAAESRARAVAQRADCDIAIKQLAMLSVIAESPLRDALAVHRARLPAPAPFEVASVPAAVLSQRPDLAAAERAVDAAAAEVGAAQADRYPRLSLTGSIGRSALRLGGQTLAASTWSFGPAFALPIFDAGRRNAAIDASRARFAAAQAAWHASALNAVREVEQALVRLDATDQRLDDARRAVQGFEEFLVAATSQWEAGVASLLELEQARRTAQAASAALVQTQRERVVSWLALYKAIGGGWQSTDPASRSMSSTDTRTTHAASTRATPR